MGRNSDISGDTHQGGVFMITLYDRYETGFLDNGLGILSCFDAEVEEELNGIFRLTFKLPDNDRLGKFIVTGATLRADVPGSLQPFRIWSVKNLDGILNVTAYHISFDLYFTLIEDKNLVDLGSSAALTRLLEDTPFTAISDVTTTASARVVRKSVQQAIFGDDDNSFLPRWGGEFIRDGFILNARNFRGRTFLQNPVAIRVGKNLVSYESDEDESTYFNRIMPIGFDGLLLPEKYVDRPGIDLNDIRMVTVEYSDIKAIVDPANPGEDELPLADAEQAMRDRVAADFIAGKWDTRVNYRVSFVDLSKTEEYKNIAVLETRYLGDELKVIRSYEKKAISDPEIARNEIIARVVSYRFDPLNKEYLSMELGNFREKPMNIISKLEIVAITVSELSQRQVTEQHITDLITSAVGGKVDAYNGSLYAMDTDDPLTAQIVAVFNRNGMGFSSTGVNGPFVYGFTRDGVILGSMLLADSVTVNKLNPDVGQNLDLSSNTSINLKVTEAIDNIQIGVNNLIKDANIVNAVGTMDKTRYLVDGTITHTNAQTTGGFYFTLTGLKPNKEYVLGFKATALSGALINMGGSNDSAWDVNEVYFDGVKQVGTWKSIHAFTGGEVMVKFTTSATVADSHRIYIQPNYNLTDTVTAKIEKLRMFDGHYLHSVWERNPDDPIKTLTVTVKSDGMYVDDGTSPVIARHTADGLRIIERSSGNNIATYTGDGSEVDFLRVNRISSMVVGTKMPWTRNVYVASTPTGDGTGRDASNKSSSVEVALKTALDGATDLQYNAQINVNIAGAVNEDVLIHGIGGMGVINLIGAYGTTQINGSIQIRDTTVPVKINGVTALGVDSSDLALIHASGLCNVQVENCRIDGANTKKGFGAYHGAILRIKTCPVVNCTVAYDASSMSQIFVYDTYGQGNVLLMFAQDMARIGVFYRKPNATTVSSVANGGEVIDTATATGSSFSVTPPVWKATTRTFSADLSSVNMASGYVWANGKWTQGTRDGASQKGVADFGLNIKTWLESAGGYQNISSVIIKARRNLSSGSSAPVSLKIGSPSAQTLPAVGYGATSQATLIAALVTAMTSGALKLNSTTTATADYAAYDLVEIIVTAEKKA